MPETFVIFITEHDVLKGNEQIYHIERTIKEDGRSFGDGSKIIYVNGNIRSGSLLGDLMHDFFCRDASKIKGKTLADCATFFKSPDKGGVIMSSVVEKLIAEGKVEGKIEGKIEDIRALMDSLNLTAQAVMNLLKISPEMQKELAPLI